MKTSLRIASFAALVICFGRRVLRPEPPRHPKRRDRRRRRSSATLGCGLCRPRRCSRTVSGPSPATGAGPTTFRATPTSATSPARLPSASGTGRRSSPRSSFDTRIDRDVRPIFIPATPTIGSFVDRYPRVNRVWTGDNVGDWYVGGKVNLLSEFRQNPAALALRGVLKIPTGDEEIGQQHGQGRLLGRLHRQQGRLRRSWKWPGMPGTSGAASRTASTRPGGAFRWGGGLGFPTRSPVRIYTELNGSVLSDGTSGEPDGEPG